MNKSNWYSKWGVFVALPLLAALICAGVVFGRSTWEVIPTWFGLFVYIPSFVVAFVLIFFGVSKTDNSIKAPFLALYYGAWVLIMIFVFGVNQIPSYWFG